jgi:hypothetical protein
MPGWPPEPDTSGLGLFYAWQKLLGQKLGMTQIQQGLNMMETSVILGKSAVFPKGKQPLGLLAELADAMDSKSISQKEYRFKSDRGHPLIR